jgi:hypothetical protein
MNVPVASCSLYARTARTARDLRPTTGRHHGENQEPGFTLSSAKTGR